jgi:hypothetical protein
MRQAKKDRNQTQIVEELRKMGFSVAITHRLGSGFPDIVVGDGRTSRNYLFEIKSDGGKLTPDEDKFAAGWKAQWNIIYSTEDALKIMENELWH